MNVFFYVPVTDKADEIISKVVDMIAPTVRTEVFHSVAVLSDRLCRPAGNPAITVLFIPGRGELLEVVSRRDLLSETSIVLILPDREEGTTSAAHTLRPRFMTCLDAELAEVRMVLERMIENQRRNEAIEEWRNEWNL